MKEMNIPAPAKINLALKVDGVRTDGYHNLEMIMQSIGLHDEITLKKRQEGIVIKSDHPSLPLGQKNLAYQAAALVFNQYNISGGIEIYINKRIPVAAGLAGGSTDAAAVLKGINQLYKLNLNHNELHILASKLGSDVPFCLNGGTAYATGRGEQIEQLPDITKTDLVIITPPFAVSTADIYHKYDQIINNRIIPISKLLNIIQTGKEISWQEGWANDLEIVTANLFADIKMIKRILKEMGVIFTLMSGSGPTVFGILNDEGQADLIRNSWPRSGDFLFLTSTIRKEFKELW